MKKILKEMNTGGPWMWAVFLTLLFAAAPAAFAKQLYTCPMHPQVIRDAPGDCPICGMHLVPVAADRAAPSDEVQAPAPSHPDAAALHEAASMPDMNADKGKMAMPATQPQARKIKYYKSTMMPGEVSPTPAKDSMGMDMVPVYEEPEKADAPSGPTTMLRLDSGTIQRMNLKTAPVESGPFVREVRALGEVTYNERTQRDVSLKFDGWVERLYVNATWTDVKAGDPLFEVYSPELYSASLNYITARRSEGPNLGPLTVAATERLRLYGVPEDYLTSLAALDNPPRTMLVRAPVGGTVTAKRVVEGRMLKAGEVSFSLADLSSVWVLAQVYESDAALVKTGARASVRVVSGDGKLHEGVVSLVEPVTDLATRANTVRVVLANPDHALKPGMYADVRLQSNTDASVTLVPDTAVLRSGGRDVVFVAQGDGRFAPREVTLGPRDDANRYEVKSGLHSGETVVTSGQFLLDSESGLREALAKMLADNR